MHWYSLAYVMVLHAAFSTSILWLPLQLFLWPHHFVFSHLLQSYLGPLALLWHKHWFSFTKTWTVVCFHSQSLRLLQLHHLEHAEDIMLCLWVPMRFHLPQVVQQQMILLLYGQNCLFSADAPSNKHIAKDYDLFQCEKQNLHLDHQNFFRRPFFQCYRYSIY